MKPRSVFATPLALCLAFLPALTFSAQTDIKLRILDSRDPGYPALLSEIPEFAGATKIVRNEGRIERAFFPSASPDQLHALAEALLHRIDAQPEANLQPDPAKAIAFQSSPDTAVTVYQHRIGDLDVVGSLIIAKIHADGSAEVINALVPTRASRNPFPHEMDAVALHQTGAMRKAYRITGERYAIPVYISTDVSSGIEKTIDAESMRIVEINGATKDDVLPDDIFWQTVPAQIVGTDIASNQPAICEITAQQLPTPYYPSPYLLNPFNATVNIQGLAARLRAPSLGLTSLQFLGNENDFMYDWPSWSSIDIASIIYRHPLTCQYLSPDGTLHISSDAIFPPPLNYNGDLLPDKHNLYQYRELQTAIEDIRDRFDWKGLGNAYNQLMFVQDMDRDIPSCSTKLPVAGHPFSKILCSSDAKAIAKGAAPRIPPIETMAHEFGHTIVYDKGISDYANASNEIGAVAESISDMFGIYVKSKHQPGSPWIYGNRPEFMERVGEYRCKNIDIGYCAITPPAIRDIANPKTMDTVRPAANFYYGSNYVSWDVHRSGQLISYMEYLMADGSPGGARDDDPAKGSYDLFVGIGFEEMYEIFFKALDGLPLVQSNPSKADHAFTNQLVLSAQLECGEWSYAERLTRKAQWIINLSDVDGDYTNDVDVDLEEAGYTSPQWGDAKVPSLVKFEFVGEPAQPFEFQIATDIEFQTIVASGNVATDVSGKAAWHQKLDPDKSYWWRVRWAAAPMKSSAFVDQNSACWRVPAPFATVRAAISNPSPAGQNSASGDESDAWRAVFTWTGSDQWQGYEIFVDDEENPKGRYSDFWAHVTLEGKELAVDPENPGTPAAPNFAMPPLPLPGIPDVGEKVNHWRALCWKIVPFLYDGGKRMDGDVAENCFRSVLPQTQITHPAPPLADGSPSPATAQPLSIDYIPAIGTEHHEFSLELLQLSGLDPPAPEGKWAYVDNVEKDPKNRVVEDYSASDWSSRTRLRMLPVQLDDIADGTNHGLQKVRLSIHSVSPTIPAPNRGGTYKARVEKGDLATVDFHPIDPPDFVDLHPEVLIPNDGQCSSPDNTDLTLKWKHGTAATPDLVGSYGIRLYPEPCNNGVSMGCHLPIPPIDPALSVWRSVERNDKPTQSLTLSRQGLFPNISDEETDLSGYLVQVHGLSGDEPGPKGLNITGTFQTSMPVLPAKLETQFVYMDLGVKNPQQSNFSANPLTSRSPDHPAAAYAYQYSEPRNHFVTRIYKGDDCRMENVITSTDGPGVGIATVFLDDPALGGDAHPVVSANVEMHWPDEMKCYVAPGKCQSLQGTNYLAKPSIPTGLQAHEADSTLGFSWNPPTLDEPDPSSVYYEVSVEIGDGQTQLAHPPGVVTRFAGETDVIGNQIGIAALTYLEPSDAGKSIVLAVRACRQANDRCSEKVGIAYVIGAAQNLPNPPTNVAFHFDDPGLQQMWNDLVGIAIGPSNHWIQVSFDPPADTLPDYYIVTFRPTGNVPGILPTWLNALNAGVTFPGDPLTYSTIVDGSGGGLVFGSTAWAAYVIPLAETETAGKPSPGQILNVEVRACTGVPPIANPAAALDWIIGASTTTCSAPAAASVQM